MRTIAPAEYETMAKGAEVLARDAFGEKVLRLPNGEFLKLFRPKGRLSSAAWNPYAVRFALAADRCLSTRTPRRPYVVPPGPA